MRNDSTSWQSASNNEENFIQVRMHACQNLIYSIDKHRKYVLQVDLRGFYEIHRLILDSLHVQSRNKVVEYFSLQLSTDGIAWLDVINRTTNGKTFVGLNAVDQTESYEWPDQPLMARFVRMYVNSSNNQVEFNWGIEGCVMGK